MNCRTRSSRIPSLSSSLSQASPWPSLSKSSCPELGRLGQLSWKSKKKFRGFTNTVATSHKKWNPLKYLLAVISGVGTTHEVVIGPSVQVRVFSTDETISSVAGPALTLVHGVTEVVDVDAFGIFVAVVGFVFAGVLWLAHLQQKKIGFVRSFSRSAHCLDQATAPWPGLPMKAMICWHASHVLLLIDFSSNTGPHTWFPFCS